jgi:hypothetical protein
MHERHLPYYIVPPGHPGTCRPRAVRLGATRCPKILGAVALAALLLLVPATSAGAAESFFGAGEEIGIPRPQSIAVGDFNGDGRADLAAVSYSGGYVVIRLGAAGGGFTAAPNVTVGKSPERIAVADFNGDGRADLAVGNDDDKDVSVRLGAGDGTFASAADIEVGKLPFAIVAGDFNTDARDDLAIAQSDAATGAEVTVRLGAGNGTFTPGGTIAVPAARLAVGDFNADGREDLAYGAFGNLPAGVLVGAGDGAFTKGAEISLPGSANSADAWAVGDFNADGREDVAAAVGGSDLVGVRLGSGDGKFSGGPDVPVGDTPYTAAIADVDGDGNEDFGAPNSGGATVSIRLGDGAGGFRAADDVPVAADPVNAAFGDFDGDGRQDLAAASYANDVVSVRYGSSSPPLDGNLLANGGFEGAGAAAVFTQSPAIPGWERSGGITFVRYGLTSHAFSPSLLDSPRYATGGLNLLWGGNSSATGGVTEAFQVADVSAASESIDAGRASANLSAYLGGALAFNDTMSARADFLGGAGEVLGSFQIGPVTAADRNNLTTLLRRQGSRPVPAGTRRVRVTVTSIDEDKSYSSAFADNVKLTLDAPAAQPEQQPGGGTPPPSPRCGGKPATIVGSAARDVLRGTRRADVIVALGGNDRVTGRGGKDVICGGRGRDRLSGGRGSDRLAGGPQRDTCIGGAARDRATACEIRRSL